MLKRYSNNSRHLFSFSQNAHERKDGGRKMKVRVHYLGFIQNMLKKREDEFELREKALLSDLLNKIAGIYGESFKKEVYEPGLKDVKTGFVVTVNGVLVGQLHGVDTRLNEGDSVILMTLMSGG
jgi:molybdopterin converting factor small subunit